jgi:tRNA(Leu) C34 or U34 (ribose-2'-O)-methylase TrmL
MEKTRHFLLITMLLTCLFSSAQKPAQKPASDTIAKANYVVRIPMSHHVDSLNVAAAAAVAFWELRT